MNGVRIPSLIENQGLVPARPNPEPIVTKEISQMLMYEELARARIQELMEVARMRGSSRRFWAAVRRGRMARWTRRHRS